MRLTLWYLAILLAILVAFAAVVYLGLARWLRAEIDHSLELAAGRSVELTADGRPRLVADTVPSGYIVSLYGPGGQLLGAGRRGRALPLDPEIGRTVARGRDVWRSVEVDDDSWRVLARPVVADGRVVAMLQVGRSEEAVEDAVEQLGLLLMALIPLAVLLAGAGGLFLAGRALDPIDRITRTAAAIGAEDLSRRLPETAETPDELGRLAATLNHMLDRLEGAFRRQRQFTADASHELRTPVTLLVNQMDIALDRPRSPEEYREMVRSMREDATRLRRLLDVLLALARADAQQEMLTRERVDLGALAEQVVDAMEPLAGERGVRLTAASDAEATVQGDEAHLMQLLMNLIENALKHTPTGGSVTVTVAVDSGDRSVLLAVRDTGIGIAPEHLPHLFERFYRVDPARSAGGAGLGLAISRWIAEAHGGRIDVESRPGEGSTFTVRLPRDAG